MKLQDYLIMHKESKKLQLDVEHKAYHIMTCI